MPSDFINKITREFKNYEKSLNGEKESQFFALQRSAFESLLNIGIPTIKHEEWKYTNLNFLNKLDFELSSPPIDSEYNLDLFDIFGLTKKKTNLIVIINGFFSSQLTSIVSDNNILTVGSKLKNKKIELNQFIEFESDYNDNPFAALNTALSQDEIYIEIKDNVILNEPVQIIFINDSRQSNTLILPRMLIEIGKNSQADILETYYNIGNNKYFFDAVTEIVIEQNAILDYFKIQTIDENSYHISEVNAEQHLSSNVNTFTITIGGSFIRNNLNIRHKGERCQTSLSGLYLTDGDNLIDNHTLIKHCYPDCSSNEYYKGILDDNSTAVFNGKIIVEPGAQKTSAYQLNKNILLTDTAQLNTKPQLEIYADDVKCSHGATTGSLDEEALFYLRSRGISEVEARRLLISAFASEIINMIKFPELIEYLSAKLDEKLGSINSDKR